MKHSLHVLGGVVDRSYRGNVKVILYNGSSIPYEVQQGDKISQFILERFSKPPIVLVDELPSSERGTSGFGSSGNSVQDTTKAGSNHITILNHHKSQHTHPSTLMSDIQRFLTENESLQSKMADYLGYASELRYGDVLPLPLQACTALVLKLAAVERFLSDSQSLGLGAYPTNRPVEAPTTRIFEQESVQAHCDQPQLSGNQDSAKDRDSTTVEPPSSTQDPLEDQWAPDEFQGNWGYPRLPNLTPTALNFISCSVANFQEVDLWADTPQFQEARVRSTQPEQDPTQPKCLVHMVQPPYKSHSTTEATPEYPD